MKKLDDSLFLAPDSASPDELPLTAAEQAELAEMERHPALQTILCQEVRSELESLERDGDWARFGLAILDQIEDQRDDERSGAPDAARMAALESPALAQHLRAETDRELDRRDGEWSAFSASVFRRIQEEERLDAKLAPEERAAEELKLGVAGELDQMERRFERDFQAEMERRLDRPATARPRRLLPRAGRWISDRMEVLGTRRGIGGLGVAAAAAAALMTILFRTAPLTEDPLAQVEDDMSDIKRGWAEPVSIDDMEFDGTITVLKGTADGVTVIWLGDET